MKSLGVTVLAIVAALLSSPVLADVQKALPSGVSPLPTKQVIHLYAGNTFNFSDFSYFYDLKGGVLGVSTTPASVALGSWTVANNRFCVDVTWRATAGGDKLPFNACYDWYSDGRSYWTQISSSSDSSLIGNVYQGNPQIVQHGDQVSSKLRTMGTASTISTQ